MADVFVHDGATGGADGTTWADAYTTALAGVNGLAAGDRLIVSSAHNDQPGQNQTYNWPGTIADPNIIISADDLAGGSVVTYKVATTDQFDTSDGAFDQTHNCDGAGTIRFYGIRFAVGDDLLFNGESDSYFFEDCTFRMVRSSSSVISMGQSNGENIHYFKDCQFTWSATAAANSGFSFSINCNVFYEGGTITFATVGGQLDGFFNAGDRTNHIHVSGMDLSDLEVALTKVSNPGVVFEAHDCLINANASLSVGAVVNPVTRAFMSGGDDTAGNNIYPMET